MTNIDIDWQSKSGCTFNSIFGYEAVGQTTEKPVFLLRNPSASGVRALITHLSFGTDSTVTRSKFRTYINPTITADGTALAEVNCSAMASPCSSMVNTFKNPTLSANGSLIACKLMPADSPSDGQNRSIIVDENYDMLVTVENDVTNVKSYVQVYWVEL